MSACGQAPTHVISPDAYLVGQVGGLERTNAQAEQVPINGQPFQRALRVTTRATADETNATQLTLLNEKPVAQGDVLLASLWLRGDRAGKPARIELLFETATSPWDKSMWRTLATDREPNTWRKYEIPFASAGDYARGQAMLSIRLATGVQRVEIAGLTLQNYAKTITLDALYDQVVRAGGAPVELSLDLKDRRQTLAGMGGNFCQPRYGSSEAMDAVGLAILERLPVAYARVGLPLNSWAPEPGKLLDDGPARANLEAMKLLKSKGIGIIATVWEGPTWMLGGQPEQMGRVLPDDKWDDCIESLGAFFLLAKTKYGVLPDYFSFNEPDYGVNFRFTPEAQARFIRQASKAWAAKGIPMKFLIGDTANGQALKPYAEHLMSQPDLLPVLGPLAYHTWDSLAAPDEAYEEIAEMARQYGRAVWATEAGHDAQLWQRPDPWASWDNALGLARAYAKSYRLTYAERLDYWTYQDNYTLLDPESLEPFAAFKVLEMAGRVVEPGRVVVGSTVDQEGVEHLASVDAGGRVRLLLANSAGATRVRLLGLPTGRYQVLTLTGQGETRGELEVEGETLADLPTRGVLLLVAN